MSRGDGGKEKDGSAFFVNTDEVKTIEVRINGAAGVFKYRELSTAESSKLLSKHAKFNPITGEMHLDIARYTTDLLMHKLVSAPFELTPENLDRLDPRVVNELSFKMQARDDIKNAKSDSTVI